MGIARVGLVQPSAAAVEAVVAEHGARVYRLAYHLTGSAQDAEDVLQEVFFKLFRNWVHLCGGANVAAWITRVVTNASIDLLRARKTRGGNAGDPALDQVAAPPDRPGAGLEGDETHRKLEEALAALPPRQLACLMLFDHEGLKAREIGRILGISDSAVRGYVFAARRRVKELLAPYLQGNDR